MKHFDDLKLLTELLNLVTEGKGRALAYFAHPMSTYGTQLEADCIKQIEAMGYTVLNPGAAWVQEAFERYREKNPTDYMTFFALLGKLCEACVALPFPKGLEIEGLTDIEKGQMMLGAGVVYEIQAFFNRGKNVCIGYQANGSWHFAPVSCQLDHLTQLDRTQTRQALKLYNPD